MNYTALALNQTPPLSVPLRFFLTAPLFLAMAAILFASAGEEILLGRWHPPMLAITHLVTLGFLGLCMVGAFLQLLPVLLGVSLHAPRLISTVLHLSFSTGISLLVMGMGWGSPALLKWGTGVLLPALVLFVVIGVHGLIRTSSRHATVPAMALALVGLALLASLALWVLVAGRWYLPQAHQVTTLHIGWGALAWIGALLIGVAYQVVPMFQITPEYPPLLRRWLVPLLGLLLSVWSLLYWYAPAWEGLAGYLLAVLVVVFAWQTLRLQAQRRRRLADVTLDFWRLAMGCLILSALVWGGGPLLAWPRLELVLGALFFLGFAVSAVNGMLYKIVPFLVWLHLNNRLQMQGAWQGGIPNMKQIIPVAATRRQYRLHLLALSLLLLTLLLPPSIPAWLAASVWLVSTLTLWWNLLQAFLCYRKHLAAMG